MKVIDLGHHDPTLDEVIGFAKEELVVLRYPDGSVFALSQVDDIDVEVELLKKNSEFKAFLKQLSEEEATISLESLHRNWPCEKLPHQRSPVEEPRSRERATCLRSSSPMGCRVSLTARSSAALPGSSACAARSKVTALWAAARDFEIRGEVALRAAEWTAEPDGIWWGPSPTIPSNRSKIWLSPPSLLASVVALGLVSRIVVGARAQLDVDRTIIAVDPAWKVTRENFEATLPLMSAATAANDTQAITSNRMFPDSIVFRPTAYPNAHRRKHSMINS